MWRAGRVETVRATVLRAGKLLVAVIVAVIVAVGVLSTGAASAAQVPNFGNPGGHFSVPAAARAVNTTHPDHVIGNGGPASCTSAAVVRDAPWSAL